MIITNKKDGLVDRKRKCGSTEIGHHTYKGHKRDGDMGGYKLNSVKEMIVIAKEIKKQNKWHYCNRNKQQL